MVAPIPKRNLKKRKDKPVADTRAASLNVDSPVVSVTGGVLKFTVRNTSRRTASLAYWLRRPPRGRKIPGSNPTCAGIFPGSSHTSDLIIGTPVAIPCQVPGVIGSVLVLVCPV